MVKMPRFETSCFEMGVKTLVTETGQQLPPSMVNPNYKDRKYFLSITKIAIVKENTIKLSALLPSCAPSNH